MKKFRKLKLFVLVSFITIALIFVAMVFLQPQVQAQGKGKKPPGKGKCNNNGICEYDEYYSRKSPEEQPCPDCQPKSYDSLEIEQEGLQIVCTGSSFLYSSGKVYQYKFENGAYADTWASDKMGIYGRNTSIGDADNDGLKEIIAVVCYVVREESSGKGKNKVVTRYYNSKINIFETYASGVPSWESAYLGESTSCIQGTIIADIDNDGTANSPDNELIIQKGRSVEIYEWTENGFQFVWSTPESYYTIFTIDVGDIQAGTYDGYLFINGYGAGRPKDRQYMVQFGTGDCVVAMKIIGGVLDFDKRNRVLTVTFTEVLCEDWCTGQPLTELTFTLVRHPN